MHRRLGRTLFSLLVIAAIGLAQPAVAQAAADVDTAPPSVESAEYFTDKSAPIETRGSFQFAPGEGVTDVVSYLYNFDNGDDTTLEAAADGTAVLPWTPTREGRWTLTVRSVTRAGVVSDPNVRGFSILSHSPVVTIYPSEDAGVGRPVRVEFLSELDGVTGFVYRYDGGRWKSVDEGYVSLVDIIASRAGSTELVVRAKLPHGKLSPATTVGIWTPDSPLVELTGPYGSTAIVGVPMTVKVAPAVKHVKQYLYWGLESREEKPVKARYDGTVRLPWTPAEEGYNQVSFRSVTSGGQVSASRVLDMTVHPAVPIVQSSWNNTKPTGGVGVPGRVRFWSTIPAEHVKGFRWHVDDDPEQFTARYPTGPDTQTPYTPTHAGPNKLSVQIEFSDGRLGPVQEYAFLVA
jgi:hypothetical protein